MARTLNSVHIESDNSLNRQSYRQIAFRQFQVPLIFGDHLNQAEAKPLKNLCSFSSQFSVTVFTLHSKIYCQLVRTGQIKSRLPQMARMTCNGHINLNQSFQGIFASDRTLMVTPEVGTTSVVNPSPN